MGGTSLYEYLTENYKPNEPILVSNIRLDTPKSRFYRELKQLQESGKVKKYSRGVYYMPKKSILKAGVLPSPESILAERYVGRGDYVNGYYTGLTFANLIGVTNQVPYVIEVTTNRTNVPLCRVTLEGRTMELRKARTLITKDNRDVLQLLELMSDVYNYADEGVDSIPRYIQRAGIKKSDVEKYIDLFPEVTRKNLHETGCMGVLV